MKVLFNLKRVNPFALILLLFLAGCETAEKVESKSDESSANETGIKITKAPSKDFKVTYIDPKKIYPDAELIQISPPDEALLEPGKMTFLYDSKNFPFVYNQSVHLTVKNDIKQYNFNSPDKIHLPMGTFLCAAYLCDENGICIKNKTSGKLSLLNVGIKAKKGIDLKQEMLFLNLPSTNNGACVLVDFMLFNNQLGANGNKVQLTIDQKTKITLDQWRPVKIEGLSRGRHEIRIDLLTSNNKLTNKTYSSDKLMVNIPYDNKNLEAW